jgi:hypothetical protein
MSRASFVRACGLASVFLAILLVLPVRAQVVPNLGDKVRITSRELPRGRSVGVLERSTADSVVLSGLQVSRASIDQFEVRTGRKSHWLAGAGIGLIAGVGAGAALGCAAYCGEDASTDGESGLYIGVSAVVGGLLGTLVGTLVGGEFIHSDRWTAVALGNLRIQPVAGPNGSLGLSVGMRF